MAVFEDIREFAGAALKKGAKKAKDTGRIAAYKYSSYTAGEDINKLYAKIGKLYYQKHGLAPEKGFEALCDKVTELQTLINQNAAAVDEIRIDGVIDEVVVDPED